MKKTLSNLVKLFPLYGYLYIQLINNKKDIIIQEDFYKMRDKVDNYSPFLFNHISKMTIDEKLNAVTLCYNKLNNVEGKYIAVLIPTLKKRNYSKVLHTA